MVYRYFHLRDLAWQLLIDSKVDTLPIDLNKILLHLGINAIPYNFNGLYKGGIMPLADGTEIILYSDTSTEQQARFTIAHEIGHIMLKHSGVVDNIEKEANSFSARLLMPLGILNKIGVTSAKDIAKICNVTESSAEWRAKRIIKISDRNKYGTSELEKVLIKQFEKFIYEYKTENKI